MSESPYRDDGVNDRAVGVDLPSPVAPILGGSGVVLVALVLGAFAAMEQLTIRVAAVAAFVAAVVVYGTAKLVGRFVATRTRITIDGRAMIVRAERVRPSGVRVHALWTAPLERGLAFAVDEDRGTRGQARQVLRLLRADDAVADVLYFGTSPIDTAFVARELSPVIERLNEAIDELAP